MVDEAARTSLAQLSIKGPVMALDDLCYLDLVEIGRRVQARQLSAVEVTQAVLDRIARLDSRLKSYVTLTGDLALVEAAQADAEIARGAIRGPLHGVPVAVKDLCHTKGIPTSAGMSIYKDYRPEHDATVVTRLREAGAVLLGKLKLTEGAILTHHPSIAPPINPWSAAHWTGASSSGSGVATAAGLCYGSLGTDTLGSIRFPSTMNGITGLKPSWGRVSRAGVFALAQSLDHVGPMARSAADAAAMLDAIAGPDPDDPTAVHEPVSAYLAGIGEGVRGLRIGIDRALIEAGADTDMVRATEEAAAVLTQNGALLRDVRCPSLDAVVPDALALCRVEAVAAHEATYPSRAAEYGPALIGRLEAGRALDGLAVAKIWHRREEFRGQLNTLFCDIDLLILPAMSLAAPTLADIAGVTPAAPGALFRFTAPFNMSGHPTLTLPGGKTADGLPVGFQIVARHMEEALVLRAGHAFQQVTDWHRRRAPI
jgi:amidase